MAQRVAAVDGREIVTVRELAQMTTTSVTEEPLLETPDVARKVSLSVGTYDAPSSLNTLASPPCRPSRILYQFDIAEPL